MFVEHPLVRGDRLELRRYQESVISRAVDENTLVVLPTGLGKTVIAAMVAAHRLHAYPGSKVLLLAPTKPLALQHLKTFRELLNVEDMCVLTGADAPKKRHEMWMGSRVVFATPQTIENDIVRGTTLKDVSLAIFDEAHRAVGDYSYVSIAREYLKQAKNPMTLGLTASPSSEEDKVGEICKNLGIRCVEAKTDLDADVKPYVQEVNIKWAKVDLPQDFREIQKLLQKTLKGELERLKGFGYIGSSDLSKVSKRLLLQAQAQVRVDISKGIEAFQAASCAAAAMKVNHGIELLETQGIRALDEYFSRLRSQGSKAVRKLMHSYEIMKAMSETARLRKAGIDHPKLDELVRIVGGCKGKKVLVFTQYRDSVDMIIERLNAADILCHEFIGQASRGEKSGMSQKEQVRALENFREGKYTALVATSVAEEGLDIPKVDAVVFYEPVPSEIRTIQRRGRTGRSATGEVYVLMAKGTRDEAYYWSSYHKERKMGDIVRGLRGGLKKQKTIGEYDSLQSTAPGFQSSVLSLDEDGRLKTGDSQDSGPKTGDTEETGDSEDGRPKTEDRGPETEDGRPETGDSEMARRLKVIVDVRERNREIMSALRDKCELDLIQLPVGDYLLSERVCVERKTMKDFLQSIIDKRLLAQLTEMRRNFEIPILIIEGLDGLYTQRNIHPNAVRGLIAAIAVNFNIPIIPTEDEQDTAQMLIAIARREQEENCREVALRGERKPRLMHERQRFVVESLPNVSAVLADRLLRRFGSVEDVITANEKELEEVEGIGEKKAKEIRKVVRGGYERHAL
ncbi:MAG: DEAD/DEAH box helicase [Candidatus Altiarchaeota archaeon]